MNLRNLAILGALAILMGGAWLAQRQYEKQPEAAAGKRPSVKVEAERLLQDFMRDEATADDRYNDRVLAVEGSVREVGAPRGGKVIVLLNTGNPLAAIACEFDVKDLPRLSPGDRVTVKGYCAGHNLDVLLQRCALSD
jgi:hypothetical protein